MKINVNKDIPMSDIANLLVSAFEGGSNYWYMIEKEILPSNGHTKKSSVRLAKASTTRTK